MSTQRPKRWYVYCPFGKELAPWQFGVGMPDGRGVICTRIEGLTNQEANTVCSALNGKSHQPCDTSTFDVVLDTIEFLRQSASIDHMAGTYTIDARRLASRLADAIGIKLSSKYINNEQE